MHQMSAREVNANWKVLPWESNRPKLSRMYFSDFLRSLIPLLCAYFPLPLRAFVQVKICLGWRRWWPRMDPERICKNCRDIALPFAWMMDLMNIRTCPNQGLWRYVWSQAQSEIEGVLAITCSLCDYMNKKNQVSRAQEIATQELGLCWVGQDGF